jgi:hypothetical protein
MLNEYFKTTDISNIKVSKNQKKSLNKNIQFVKGSDFYKGYYDENIVKKINVRYFQFAMFGHEDRRAVRLYILEGVSSKGACFYDYKILKIKDYIISENNLSKFANKIKNKKNVSTQDGEFKIMYKYYPVYNFDFTDPPSGSEINECQSELLNY